MASDDHHAHTSQGLDRRRRNGPALLLHRFGGLVISAAINKHIYVGLNETFSRGYFLKYFGLEHAVTLDEIRHTLIREVLRIHEVPPPLEDVSKADIPAGTGMGSSGAFTVGLLRRARTQGKYGDPAVVAEEACRIEIETLQQSVGKQGQYIAAFGSLARFGFHEDGLVNVSPLNIRNRTLYDLEEHLLMFVTGYSRNASAVLDDQKIRSKSGDSAMLDNLHYTKQLGQCIKLALDRVRRRPAIRRADARALAAQKGPVAGNVQ